MFGAMACRGASGYAVLCRWLAAKLYARITHRIQINLEVL
jgi:hypothetical protein